MVFHFRCFSVGNVAQETESADNYVTAPSQFYPRPPGSASTSRSADYISSGVPGLNGRPSTLRVFTLAELNKATKNFDQSTHLGEGGFGSVHLGTIKSLDRPFDDIRVAVKCGKKGLKGIVVDERALTIKTYGSSLLLTRPLMPHLLAIMERVERQWQTEVDFLGKIEHENLVKLIGYCHEEGANESNWLLVYEYMSKGSLDYHLSGKSNTLLSWPRRLKIARDAAVCLKYLHEEIQVIFRDFKPSNVLLDENWNAKLSDCGFVREGPQDGRSHVSTLVVGTKGYAAPEYVQTGRLTYRSDVWSYGIFLEQLITGQRPGAHKNSQINPECMRWVCCCCAGAGKSKLTADPKLENKFSDRSIQKIFSVAEKCLNTDPKLRPMMSEVLEMVDEAITLQNQ